MRRPTVILTTALTGIVGLVVVLGVLVLTPVTDPDLSPHPDPARTYADAIRRIDAIKAAESDADLIPAANSIALLSGSRTETAVVIFHGYTSVPRQFRLVAQGLRDEGHNVWVPRLPYHGSTDRMTDDFSKLSASGLRQFADENVDIATGLGKHVVVIGFSGGGSLGVWAGAARREVSKTVLISPLLHPQGYAEWQDRPLVRALRLLPFDVYQWWDPVKQEHNVEGYSYPRISLKGIAALLSLSHWVDDRSADGRRLAASPVLLVRNDGDTRLDSAFNERFVRRTVPCEGLRVYRIPASAKLLHDLISPETYSECYPRITESYRYLSEALGVPLPDPKAIP